MEKYWSNKKMLEPLKMNVNINDIYQYKLKSFLIHELYQLMKKNLYL